MRKEHWSKLYGNRYSQNIHWGMLSNAGYSVRGRYVFINEPKPRKEDRQISEIIYDRNYVTQYIARKIIAPLQPEFNDLQKLISDAWKIYKESLQQD